MGLLTEYEIMKILNIYSTHALWNLVHRYDLPYIKLGGTQGCRFEEEVFLQALKKRATTYGVSR
jgi:hypothetical protein